MQTGKGKKIRSIVFVAAIFIMLFAIGIYSRVLREELEIQMQDTLHSVAEQNVLAVEKEIQNKQNFLEGISKELQLLERDDREKIIDYLKSVLDIYHLKRIGFIDPDGTTYTTDGYNVNLSFREFFQKGMKGEEFITDVMTDALGEKEPINVISVPVYNKDETEVSGVLFATYRTEMFKEFLSVESFGGEGYSLVASDSGSIVAISSKSPMYGKNNIFTALAGESENDTEAVKDLKELLENGKSGGGSYYLNGRRYYYCVPLKLDVEEGKWFVFTVVPSEILDNKMAPIQAIINSLLATIILVLVLAFVAYLYTYQKGRKELFQLAYQDTLTGGNNYAYFKEKIRHKMNVAGYIISMDLSEFKIINNTCGVETGNMVLTHIWEILSNEIHGNELAAHMSGDRYVLYMEDEKREEVECRIKKLLTEIEGLSEKLNVPRVVPYFGIYYTRNLADVEANYSFANHALHQIKGRRDQSFAFYEEEDYLLMLKNRSLEDGFEEAVKNQNFEIWYQPKYSTSDAEIVGAEALVRWRLDNGKLVSPGRFIPLLEQNGMIAVLDEYVFRSVCEQQKQWMVQGKRILPVSVNISRASLYYSNIVERYRLILDEYKVDAQYVQLEITESATVNNKEIKGLIDQFHKAGFQLLLDDFGNGYSSLASLNEMQFDVLKLDKSLIDHIGDRNGEMLLYHIVNLVKSLGLRITAEGVESEEQVGFLKQLHCNDIQGFYFSKPLPCEKFETML